MEKMEKKNQKKSDGNLYVKYGPETAVPSPSDGYYPTITLNGKAVPELADKKIGDTCKIELMGKIKSMNAVEGQDIRIEFEAHNAEYGEPKESKSQEKYEKGTMKKPYTMLQRAASMRKKM